VFALNLSQAELVLYFQFIQQFQIKLYDLSWPKMKNNDGQMQMKTNPPLEKKKNVLFSLEMGAVRFSSAFLPTRPDVCCPS
jgi:hypothetical protein